jgi:pimeloyl-[acyl-carrier protein] methyl ester esterase
VAAPVVTLVLLPGMDGSGALFAGFVAALGEGIAPLVLSYPPDQPLGYQGLTDFVRTRLPVGQRYVLLGESFSGPVAIALAAERPADLIGLVLSCTFARNPVPLLRHCSGLIPYLPISSKFTSLAAPLLLGRHALPALRGVLDQVRSSVLRGRMRAVFTVDYSERAHTIAVPVLYLQAVQDRVVSRRCANHLAALLPGMTIKSVRGPHLLLQAAPEETASNVRHFVEQLASY